MKGMYFLLAIVTTAAMTLSACAPSTTPVSEPPAVAATDVPTEPAVTEAPVPTEPATAPLWTQEYITQVPPIMMFEPYFEIFGQSQTAVPYTYETAVKLAGHSCGATAGAWTITRKALEALYPNGEIPVRGQISVEAPGAADEWYVGVFGEVITYVTGAAPKTGFIGSEFGQVNDLFIRQNKMIYMDAPSGTPPPQMEWIFTRLDTGAKVGVNFNLSVITPLSTPERTEMGAKMAAAKATPEEAAEYYEYWNARAKFVFENADTLDGFFNVKVLQEGTAGTPNPIVEQPVPEPAGEFAWDQAYISEVPPIMMTEPYFGIFGQTSGPVPYYYDEAVKLAGHSCGATTGAWVITRKALEALYPEGEIPVRGQIAVEAPGAEDEWFVGVFGDIITFVTGAAPETGFIGSEFGKANNLFIRQNKMVYTTEPTGQLPPMREWIFTRLDTGKKVGVKFNLVIILPIPTPARTEMGKKVAAGTATPEELADYQKYWNDRAIFVLDNADLDGFFTVTIYE